MFGRFFWFVRFSLTAPAPLPPPYPHTPPTRSHHIGIALFTHVQMVHRHPEYRFGTPWQYVVVYASLSL